MGAFENRADGYGKLLAAVAAIHEAGSCRPALEADASRRPAMGTGWTLRPTDGFQMDACCLIISVDGVLKVQRGLRASSIFQMAVIIAANVDAVCFWVNETG